MSEQVPNPEVPTRARPRTYSAKYKARVLAEYETLDKAGKGALLRREGLYTSLISAWREQRDKGALQALAAPAGRPAADPAERENARLRRENERLAAELAKTRKVIEVQGKALRQPRPPALRHRPTHPVRRPPRQGRNHPRRPRRNPDHHLPAQPRTVRPQTPRAASPTHHGAQQIGEILKGAADHGRIIGAVLRARPVKALAVEDLHTVRAAVRQWQTPEQRRPGPPRSSDLADIVDILLATGARIGEVLAIRWSDAELAGTSPVVTLSGTLVYLRGKGLFRQGWTKSDAGYRMVSLPKFAVDVLKRRQAEAKPNDLDAVFPSRNGTWLAPNNVRRQWRAARKDTGLEWVIPHTFRKTVATLIDQETDTKTAAAQLGHKNEEITTAYYIQKAHQAPDVSSVLDALGPDSAIGA